ncbi:hypothetical protein IB238_20530 [Rhizobium sp. ARZ01]|uniref:DUF6492 family protein n=1 Tax=Rhizobium sp. ARZ01 TaxID=2769313 RepID=UPI001781452C|nr:DUF6492 family protein [Rhizobium sp. ARZ01]MBD9375015.1 hypothetical protein [Rhizobium sp. ARZ01]
MAGTISVVTPSYSRDFESCQLLCESIDRYVSGYEMHYLVVGDEDVNRFASLEGPRRRVVASSELLPKLWPLPKWRGRRYWWAPGLGLPIYGWHLQQIRKIAMTLSQPSERIMCVDSDNCFCRPLDLSDIATAPKVTHFARPKEIDSESPGHAVWLANAHRLLGLPAPSLPGDDFIGQMIVWERETVRAMTDRIEKVTATAWWRALARLRHFSEYLIYGAAVASDSSLAGRHERTSQSHCLAYWSGPALDEAGLSRLFAELEPHQRAIAIQSHTRTPVELIRKRVLVEMAAKN